jgi:hypothetical protein
VKAGAGKYSSLSEGFFNNYNDLISERKTVFKPFLTPCRKREEFPPSVKTFAGFIQISMGIPHLFLAQALRIFQVNRGTIRVFEASMPPV